MTTPRAPRRFDERWRLSRAGFVNIWYYLDNEFDLSGGRMILRGSNGSGKSRALEMLLPFLLDADRRRMDATGAARVSLDELMRTGADGQVNRTGYLWLELSRPGGFCTIGALVRHSKSASSTKVWYFVTSLRVGDGLPLLSAAREPLSKDALTELIGADRITESSGAHRDRVRAEVFGLASEAGQDRYNGLLQLLHTLRAPDVGNRIDEGRLPQILLESLPPLHEEALIQAGDKLDGLTETRAAQERLETSARQVTAFLAVYRRYAAGTVRTAALHSLAAADAVLTAEATQREQAAAFAELERQFSHVRAQAEQLAEELDEIDHALSAIRDREIFKTADDLVQRDNAERALASAADQAIASAERERASHARTVQDAGRMLDELTGSAAETATALAAATGSMPDAGLPAGSLPAEVRVLTQLPSPVTALIRGSRDADLTPAVRPAAASAEVLPADLAAASGHASVAATVAADRSALAGRRLTEARRLTQAHQQVLLAESEAGGLREAAEDDDRGARERASQRDTAAIALAQDWRAWTASAPDLLGDIDWAVHPVVGPLILDAEALTGPAPAGDLGPLDRVAQDSARQPRAKIDSERTLLTGTDQIAGAQERELRAERDRLAGQHDQPPDDPPWLAADRPGEPLWRCVDFRGELTDADQGGLEGALLGAGLLTAVVQPDGTVLAADGQVLLSPARSPAARPLSLLLGPDPAALIDAGTIAAILTSIELDDPAGPVSVSPDGSWRNGPLRGRHVTAKARHIGAAARALHRQERIAAIDAELAELARAASRRAQRRAELEELTDRIEELVSSAPRSADLHGARRVAADALDRAGRAAAKAEASASRARELRTSWAAESGAHQAICAHLGLPAQADALDAAVTAARNAREKCELLARGLAQLASRARQHREQLLRVEDAVTTRDDTEQAAEERWSRWHAAASELAAQHDAIDLPLERARVELDQTQAARERTSTDLKRAQQKAAGLGPKLGDARRQSQDATGEVKDRIADMAAAARRFNWCLARPGLVAAAAPGLESPALESPAPTLALPIDQPDQVAAVRSAADVTLTAIAAPRQAASMTMVSNAFGDFDREVSGQLDVRHEIEEGLFLVEVAGAGDERTLAGAARTLTARVAEGRAALTERERAVFTRFVLGGVAEELRRRVNQAGQLIGAMNASLREIRTSNGIGVRLGWQLRDDYAALGRILELVATAEAVRSEQQNTELTDLLRQRVEHYYSADPSSGYAVHLAAALDYRQWHEVTVTILGPGEGQQRRLSRRAKLSQGETRFVSYVTLFAAADGYLTSLGDDGRALRLILLDDAFAKVDDATVAELMGMLVSLDLDFVMTGHALWGCFPQVPKLDIYEVRRSDGSSAVTTHVHWDGRNRHLRSTV